MACRAGNYRFRARRWAQILCMGVTRFSPKYRDAVNYGDAIQKGGVSPPPHPWPLGLVTMGDIRPRACWRGLSIEVVYKRMAIFWTYNGRLCEHQRPLSMPTRPMRHVKFLAMWSLEIARRRKGEPLPPTIRARYRPTRMHLDHDVRYYSRNSDPITPISGRASRLGSGDTEIFTHPYIFRARLVSAPYGIAYARALSRPIYVRTLMKPNTPQTPE